MLGTPQASGHRADLRFSCSTGRPEPHRRIGQRKALWNAAASRGGWRSLTRAPLNERPGLFESGREVPLYQQGFGERFSFPAAQDTHFAGGPVINDLHDRPVILGWPIRFPGVQSLRAAKGINRRLFPGLAQ